MESASDVIVSLLFSASVTVLASELLAKIDTESIHFNG